MPFGYVEGCFVIPNLIGNPFLSPCKSSHFSVKSLKICHFVWKKGDGKKGTGYFFLVLNVLVGNADSRLIKNLVTFFVPAKKVTQNKGTARVAMFL